MSSRSETQIGEVCRRFQYSQEVGQPIRCFRHLFGQKRLMANFGGGPQIFETPVHLEEWNAPNILEPFQRHSASAL